MIPKPHTVADVCSRYEREIAPHKAPTTAAEDARRWRKRILPALGDVRADRLTTEQVTDLHLALRDTPYEANRVLNLLQHAFNLAELWRWRPQGTNPCKPVRRFTEKKRRRFLSVGELTAFGDVLAELEAEQRVRPTSADAVRLLFLTGCRKREVLSLQWDHVDLAGGLLHLPTSKEGPRVVILILEAVEILRRRLAAREAGCPHVFPGRNGNHLQGLQKAWGRCRDVAARGTRPHDTRRTFACAVLNAGASLDRVSQLLDHADISTTRERYAFLDTAELRRAVENAAGLLAPITRRSAT